MTITYLIPDIAIKLKTMLIQWFDSRNQTVPAGFLQVLDEIVDFILQADAMQKATKLVEIYDIIVNEFNYKSSHIKVLVLEEDEIIPTIIEVTYDYESCDYDISPHYMEELRQKAIPKIPYKDAGYCRTIPDIVLNTTEFYASISYLDVFTEIDRLSIQIDKLKDDKLKNTLDKFINNDKNQFMLVNYTDELTYRVPEINESIPMYYQQLQGIRIYKIPEYDFSEELNYLRSVKRLTNLDSCYEFLYHYIGLEIAPDNYLELYSTPRNLNRLFLDAQGALHAEEANYEIDIEPSIYRRNYGGFFIQTAFYRGYLGSKKNILIINGPKINPESRQEAELRRW